jgi:polyvinyl alcohol dehydrogenase (cytochrome)
MRSFFALDAASPFRATLLAAVALTGAAGCGKGSSAQADAGAPPTTCGAESTDWPMWGHNVCNTASPTNSGGLSKDNVGNLKVKWTYPPQGQPNTGDVSATPAVVGGAVYFPDWSHMINKVDAETGALIWSKNINDLMASSPNGSTLPDFYSRTTPLVYANTVIIGTLRSLGQVSNPGPSAFLVALDKDTAGVKWITPLHEGHPAAVITGSPVLDGNTLYLGVSSQEEFSSLVSNYTCCTFRGSVVAVNADTGELKWRTHTISDALYYGSAGPGDGGILSTYAGGYAGNAIWSSTPAIDRKRHQLYVTTGNNYIVPSGAQALVEGNYVDAVMALDLDTGKINWGQALPAAGAANASDSWTVTNTSGPDSDFGAGANLYTANVNGTPTDFVGAGQKSGTYFAFNPDNGKIVWQTAVGPGGHLGGIHWGTAADGQRVYVGVNNEAGSNFTLLGNGAGAGTPVTTGLWAALDAASGAIIWETANPKLDKPLAGASVNGPVTVVNGVVFAGSMDSQGFMFALDAATGTVLWNYPSGATVYGGPAISNGVVYWGSGYPSSVRPLGFGTSGKSNNPNTPALYAFAVP